MDLNEILDATLALIGLPGLLLIGLIVVGFCWRRRHPPADRAEAEARRTPLGVWLLIAVLAVGFTYLDSAAARWWLVPAYLVLVVAVMVLVVFWPRRDEFLLARRVRRGDLAGAIAALEARVAPEAGPVPLAVAPVDDPWAAPASASRPSSRGWTLAHRCNLLGLLEFRRENWAGALDWYERAERAGGGGIRDLQANKGAALVRLGRVAEGLALIREVFDGLPTAGNRPVRAKVTFQLTGALIRAGQLDEARARLVEAEAEVDRFLWIQGRARPPFRDAARTLRDRLAAADAARADAPPLA